MCAMLISDQASCGDGPRPLQQPQRRVRRFDGFGSASQRLQQTRQPAKVVALGEVVGQLAAQHDRLPQRCDRRFSLAAQVTREGVPLQPDDAIVVADGVGMAQCERVQARGFPIGAQRCGPFRRGYAVADGRIVVAGLVGMKCQCRQYVRIEWRLGQRGQRTPV